MPKLVPEDNPGRAGKKLVYVHAGRLQVRAIAGEGYAGAPSLGEHPHIARSSFTDPQLNVTVPKRSCPSDASHKTPLAAITWFWTLVKSPAEGGKRRLIEMLIVPLLFTTPLPALAGEVAISIEHPTVTGVSVSHALVILVSESFIVLPLH